MDKKDLSKIIKQLEDEKQDLIETIKRLEERERNSGNDFIGDEIDHATNDSQREILFSLSDIDRQKLDLIEEAIQKIDEDRYGTCEKCGKKIGIARLRALPYARSCINCD